MGILYIMTAGDVNSFLIQKDKDIVKKINNSNQARNLLSFGNDTAAKKMGPLQMQRPPMGTASHGRSSCTWSKASRSARREMNAALLGRGTLPLLSG